MWCYKHINSAPASAMVTGSAPHGASLVIIAGCLVVFISRDHHQVSCHHCFMAMRTHELVWPHFISLIYCVGAVYAQINFMNVPSQEV